MNVGSRLKVLRLLLMLALGIVLALAVITVTSQPAHEKPGYDAGISLGASPAAASWYFTCGGDSRHRHYLRGKTHIWNRKDIIHRGGRTYNKGVWKTFDWGREVVTARDTRTYGPC